MPFQKNVGVHVWEVQRKRHVLEQAHVRAPAKLRLARGVCVPEQIFKHVVADDQIEIFLQHSHVIQLLRILGRNVGDHQIQLIVLHHHPKLRRGRAAD